MIDKNISKSDVPAAEDSQDKNMQNRRDTLKKAGIAGGALAGAVWAKPVINTVVLPAHAVTSDVAPDAGTPPPISLTGPTGSPAMGSLNKETDTSIAERVVETLIPNAAAAGTAPPNGGARFAFSPGERGLCVTLDFPQGNTPSGPINVSVVGPDIDYYYNGSQSYTLSSAGVGTLSGLDFTVNLSGSGGGLLQVSGCLSDANFSGATGFVELTRNVPAPPARVDEFSGYGAPFTAGLNTMCSPGSGVMPS